MERIFVVEKVAAIIELLEAGKQAEANARIEELIKFGSNEERFLLTEELMQLGFLEEAKKLMYVLLEYYPGEGELLVMLAEIYIELGQEDEAILTLEQVDASEEAFGQALLLLADLYQMQGLFEVSEQKLFEAKNALPDEKIIDFALAELLADQGKVLDAKEYYLSVLEETDVIAGTNINQRLAELLSVSGEFEEALKYYELALDDQLEINTLFGYGFTALQAGYNNLAIEQLEALKEIDAEYHSLYIYLARAYERELNLEKCLETIKDGIKQDEFNKELYFYGGKIAMQLKREEAEKLLREAIALDPEYLEAISLLNKLLINQEDYEGVIELLEVVGDYAEEDPQLVWDIAISYKETENYSLALNKYEHAYNFFKDDVKFLEEYGYFLLEEGLRDKAKEIFKQLLENEPTSLEYQEMYERLT